MLNQHSFYLSLPIGGLSTLILILARLTLSTKARQKPKEAILNIDLAGRSFHVSVGVLSCIPFRGGSPAALGGGLLRSFTIQLDTGKYVGYQLLVGVDAGLCFQAPVMVGQLFVKPTNVAGTTAILLCEYYPWYGRRSITQPDSLL